MIRPIALALLFLVPLAVAGCGHASDLMKPKSHDAKAKERSAKNDPEKKTAKKDDPSSRDGASRTQAPASASAPSPQLGARGGSTLVLGLTASEIASVNAAPAGTRLASLKAMVLKAARLDAATLKVQPNRHLTDREKSEKLPASEALDLGFLIEWNDLMDALGLAYALTGDAKYAERVGDQLLPWANYSPPMGEGLEKGGEPSVYHRNFFGCFRAADQCWPALSPEAKAAAVHLAKTIQDRLEDWWNHTPWERGNHAAATAQTGIYAAILLVHAAASDPTLFSADDAQTRLEKFLNAGESMPQEVLVGGDKREPGLLGFGPQVLIGIYTPATEATYRTRGDVSPEMLGASIDFFYKPPEKRFGYHALVLHHMFTAYWAIVRSGLDKSELHHAAEVRAALGSLLEFTRPYLERGEVLKTAKGKAGNPATHAQTREVVAMAARLFPEKEWLVPLPQRGDPVSFTEIYEEVAQFK